MKLVPSRLFASRSVTVLSGIALSVFTSAVIAEELEEIVVTAQKTSENIQDVPIAITAITAATLQTKGINSVAQLAAISPNVTMDAGTPFSASDTVLAAFIRGIGQNDFAINFDPGVAVYMDGVYLARSVGANTGMLDVDRVEILKGPQGTLFGRNTIGGAISIVTRDPGDKYMAKGEVTGGSYNRIDAQGTADIPISDQLRTSVSFSRQSRDGWQKRIAFPTPVAGDSAQAQLGGTVPIPDCDALAAGTPCPTVERPDDFKAFPRASSENPARAAGIDKWSVRGKAVFDATDALKLTLTADYTNVDEPSQANTTLTADPNAATLGGVYNGCLFGAPIGVVCSTPRMGLSPTPTSTNPLPPLGGVNVDGNPNNNRLPYDARYFIPGDVKTGNPNLRVNPDLSYATGSNYNKLKNWGIAGIIDFDINDQMHLKSITSYRDMSFTAGFDQDASPVEILDVSFDIPQSQVSQEFQLTGKIFNDSVDYIVGAYYFSEWGHNHDFVPFPGGVLVVDGPNNLSTQAEAGYAHLNIHFTDEISFIAGGRFSAEQKDFEGFQTDDNGLTYKITGCFPPTAPNVFGIPGLNCQQALGFPSAAEPYRFYPPGVHSQDFRNFSPTLGVQYQPNEDHMFYMTVSQGYKSGNWTTRLSSPRSTYYDLGQGKSSLEYKPEFATTEEFGWKSEWLDRSLRLNLAAFHTDYKDMQVQVQKGISPTFVNAGAARIFGFEAEAEYAVTDAFTVTSGLGYTNAKYTRLDGVTDQGFNLTTHSCPQRTVNPDPLNPPQNGSCELAKTPEWKFFIGPQYVMNMPGIGGELQFNLDYTYTSHYFNTTGNLIDTERLPTDIVNVAATYRSPTDLWELAVGGTNVLDDRYVVNGYANGGVLQSFATFSDPAEWYATLRVNYK